MRDSESRMKSLNSLHLFSDPKWRSVELDGRQKARKQRIEEDSMLTYEELGCATKKSTMQSTMSYLVRSNTAKDELEVLASRKKQELETTRSETSEFSRDPSFIANEVRQLDELLDNRSWMDSNSTDGDSDDSKKSTMQSTMSYFVRSNTAKNELEVLASRKKQELETTRSETSEFSRDPAFIANEVRQLDELLDNRSWMDGNSTDGEYDDDLNMEIEGLAFSAQILAEELESVEALKTMFMPEHFVVKADLIEPLDVVQEGNADETRDAKLESSGRDPSGMRDPVAGNCDDRYPRGVCGCQSHMPCTGLEHFLDEATCCPLSASDSGFHQSTPEKQRSNGERNEKNKVLDAASGATTQDGRDTIACDIETRSDLNTYPQRVLAALRQLQSGRLGNLGKEKDAQTHSTHDTQPHQPCSLPLEIGFPSKIVQTKSQVSEEDADQMPVLSSAELSSHQESLSAGLGMFPTTIDFSSRAASSRSPERTSRSNHVNMGPLYDSIRMRVQRTDDSESSDCSKFESVEGVEETKVEVSPAPINEEISIRSDESMSQDTSSSSSTSTSDSSLEPSGRRQPKDPSNLATAARKAQCLEAIVLSTENQKRESSTAEVQTSRKKKGGDLSKQNASKKIAMPNQAYRSSTKSPSELAGGPAGERVEAEALYLCGKATPVTAQPVNRISNARVVGDVEEQGQETIWDGSTIKTEDSALEEDDVKCVKRPKRFKIAVLLIGCLLLIVIGGGYAKFFFIPSLTEDAPRPLNDVCASAIGPLSTNTSQVDGSTVGATFDDVGSCGSASRSGNGVWYTIHGHGRPIKASTCQGTYLDTSIAIYSGTCGRLSCIAGNNNGLPSNQCGTQSSVTWPTSEQEMYYILVKGSTDDSNGNFTVSITETVENDVCRSAIGPIPTDGSRIGGSTVSATYDEAPECGSAMADGVGVWYVALGTGSPMVASTCGGASFETRISVFHGSCGKLLCVDRNIDSCGLQSSVSWATENGEMYYILVKGPENDAGEFSLTVKETVRNDICQAAIGPLPTDKFSISGSTQNSTVDNSPPCGKVSETAGSGVWYAVQGKGYFLSANTCNGNDAVSGVQLILYGGACDDLTCIYGYDDLCGLQSSVSWNAAPGVQYYILVQGLNANDASFKLTIEESRRGDTCDTAIRPVTTISPSPLNIEGTTEGGLYFDSSLGFCGSEPASQVAWYSVVGNGKIMAASTCTSYTNFTAVLTVYTGICGALKCASTVVQDECTSRHGDQYVSWGTYEGQEYFIVVYSDAAFEEGSFNLRLELDVELPPPEDNGEDDENSGVLEPWVYIVLIGCAVMLVLIIWRGRKFKASQRRKY